jgi:antitoxin VapB
MDGQAMPVARSKTFRSGNSEALRLPRDVAYGEGVELVIVRSGNVMTIYPASLSIPSMIERLQTLPAPSAIEQRDVEELPERDGL